MTKNITFSDMAEALHKLREKYGLYYNPSKQEIFVFAKKKNERIK